MDYPLKHTVLNKIISDEIKRSSKTSNSRKVSFSVNNIFLGLKQNSPQFSQLLAELQVIFKNAKADVKFSKVITIGLLRFKLQQSADFLFNQGNSSDFGILLSLSRKLH